MNSAMWHPVSPGKVVPVGNKWAFTIVHPTHGSSQFGEFERATDAKAKMREFVQIFNKAERKILEKRFNHLSFPL